MNRRASTLNLSKALAAIAPEHAGMHRAVASQIDAVMPLLERPSVTPVCLAKGQSHVWLARVPGLPQHAFYGWNFYTGHNKETDPNGDLSLKQAREAQACLIQEHRRTRSKRKRGAA